MTDQNEEYDPSKDPCRDHNLLATRELAEQVKRVADVLEKQIDELKGTSNE